MASLRSSRSCLHAPLPNPSEEVIQTALKSEHYGLCRICLDEAHKNKLISPCHCRGSHAYVHKDCLRKWFESSGRAYCDICKSEYVMRSTGMKPFSAWEWPAPLSDDWEDKLDFWACLIWIVFSSRVFIAFYRYGIGTNLGLITEALGRGFIRTVWVASFAFNCFYYTHLTWIIARNWWEKHQVYEWDFMQL